MTDPTPDTQDGPVERIVHAATNCNSLEWECHFRAAVREEIEKLTVRSLAFQRRAQTAQRESRERALEIARLQADARRWRALSDNGWELGYLDGAQVDERWTLNYSDLVGTPDGKGWIVAAGNTADEAIDAAIRAQGGD